MRRKISKADVEQAYELAQDAKKSALFSLRRARQLKDGADKLNRDYKANSTAAKKKSAPKKAPVKKAERKGTEKNSTPWWAREEGE